MMHRPPSPFPRKLRWWRLLDTSSNQQQYSSRNGSSSRTSHRNGPWLLLALIMSVLLLVSSSSANPVPFNRHQYPSIDLRLLDWPMAQRTETPGKQFVEVECYTELDHSYVNPSTLYRLNNTGQLSGRACLLRIPTKTRLTVIQMQTQSKESYVSVIAGSSQVFMPLSTSHIHPGKTDLYGPWHVACNQAYLNFHSKSHLRLEWVEFRLSAETAEDRENAESEGEAEKCNSDGTNFADDEYTADTESEEDSGSSSSRSLVDGQQQQPSSSLAWSE